VLIFDETGALGLDLSFVSHIFIMEPVWDAAVEEQIVARAHRLGATSPVLVEKLVMRGTVEEDMVAGDRFGQSKTSVGPEEYRDVTQTSNLSALSFLFPTLGHENLGKPQLALARLRSVQFDGLQVSIPDRLVDLPLNPPQHTSRHFVPRPRIRFAD